METIPTKEQTLTPEQLDAVALAALLAWGGGNRG